MKILVLCGGAYVSGMEIKTLTLLSLLRDRGYSIQVLTSGWTDGDFPRRLDSAGIANSKLFLGKLTHSLQPEHLRWTWDTLRMLPSALWSMRKSLKNFRPDVVLLFNRDSAILASPLLWSHKCVFHVAELPSINKLNRLLYRFLSCFVRQWVCVSEYLRTQLPALGLDPESVRVVYNGIPAEAIAMGRSNELGCVRIGICGQIESWKGHEDLIDALGILRDTGLGFSCLIYGKGSEAYQASLVERSVDLGVSSEIEWRGFVQDRSVMYAEIDILVVPSQFEEPFGLVAAEAGLNGLPVVVTCRGGLPEIVVDGETGFVVEAHSPSQLANRIGLLVSDAALRRRMGEAGRERVQRCFTVEEMARGHEQAFRDALG